MGTIISKNDQNIKKKKEGFNGQEPSIETLAAGFSVSCLSLVSVCFCAFIIFALIAGFTGVRTLGSLGESAKQVTSTPEGALAATTLLGKVGTGAKTTTSLATNPKGLVGEAVKVATKIPV